MRQKIGVIRACAALLAGILAGSRFCPPLWICIAAMLSCLAGGIFFYRRSKGYILDQKPVRIYRFLIYAAIFAAGMGRAALSERARSADPLSSYIGQESVSFTGSVDAPPVTASTRTTLRFRIDEDRTDPEDPKGGVLLLVFYSKPDMTFEYGDRLKVSGRVTLPQETGSGFSYRAYLERNGIGGMISNPRVEILPGFSGSQLKAKIFRLRSVLLEQLYRLYPKPESALMAGILLGDESQITSSVENAFQKTGTAHIIYHYLSFCL